MSVSRSNEKDEWYWLWESEGEENEDKDDNDDALSEILEWRGPKYRFQKRLQKEMLESNPFL